MSSQSIENEGWYSFFSFGVGSGTSLMSSTSSKKYSSSKPSCRDSTYSHGIAIVSFTVSRWSTDSTLLLLAGVLSPAHTANGVFFLG
jgi:hypothetical protein